MAVRCVQLVLVLGFVPADAGLFLFPALPTPTDFKGAGQSMAEEMQKGWFAIAGTPPVVSCLVCTTLGQSLPVSAGLGKQLEPSADQPKEDEQQKETRGDFQACVSLVTRILLGAMRCVLHVLCLVALLRWPLMHARAART